MSGGAERVGSERPPVSALLYEHGIAVGDIVEPMSVACSDATQRTVADAEHFQLITLSGVDDYCAAAFVYCRVPQAVRRLDIAAALADIERKPYERPLPMERMLMT